MTENPAITSDYPSYTFIQKISDKDVDVEDSGAAKSFDIDIDQAGTPRLWVTVHSWDDPEEFTIDGKTSAITRNEPSHPELDHMIGKTVKVTVEVVEDQQVDDQALDRAVDLAREIAADREDGISPDAMTSRPVPDADCNSCGSTYQACLSRRLLVFTLPNLAFCCPTCKAGATHSGSE